MHKGDKSPRHWRVIAEELAKETDHDRLRVLWEEMNSAIRFIRYRGSDDTPPPDPVVKQ
jgi:hypothetical protein